MLVRFCCNSTRHRVQTLEFLKKKGLLTRMAACVVPVYLYDENAYTASLNVVIFFVKCKCTVGLSSEFPDAHLVHLMMYGG